MPSQCGCQGELGDDVHIVSTGIGSARQCQKNQRAVFLYCARLALSFDKTGFGSAMSKNQRAVFFVLRSPCTIFAPTTNILR